MKTYEALYNGYCLLVMAKDIEVATNHAKEEFQKSLRLTKLNERYFTIKEVTK